MKRILFVMMVTIMLAMLFSCATNKRFIKIKEPDVVYEYGKGKFEVWPNDTLEIREIKTCRGGTGISWKVKKMETGEVGYVKAERMKERHEVYTKEK